jgi:hypothetical protein
LESFVVAIYPLLQDSAFGPEQIQCMASAYEDALLVLNIRDRSDPVSEVIAKKIIEVAQTGVFDPIELRRTALKRAGIRPRDDVL